MKVKFTYSPWQDYEVIKSWNRWLLDNGFLSKKEYKKLREEKIANEILRSEQKQRDRIHLEQRRLLGKDNRITFLVGRKEFDHVDKHIINGVDSNKRVKRIEKDNDDIAIKIDISAENENYCSRAYKNNNEVVGETDKLLTKEDVKGIKSPLVRSNRLAQRRNKRGQFC